MEIWIWIIIAIALSKVALGGKKVDAAHYVWMLLPIDMYGVSILGVTIKPYMIWCLLLLFLSFLKGDWHLYVGNQLTLSGLGLIFCALVINIINGAKVSALSSILMLLLVFVCGLIYVTQIHSSINQICDVICSTAIGYGIVYLTAYFLAQGNVSLPDLLTSERMNPGIVMNFGNMIDKVSFVSTKRLRGFSIDPNGMNGMFMISVASCALRAFKGEQRTKYFIGLFISIGCVIASDSRTGLICVLIIILLALRRTIPTFSPIQKKRLMVAGTLLFVGYCTLLITTSIGTLILGQIVSAFSSRSTLTSRYGRLSIWIDAISVVTKESPWIGVGTGQIQYYTSTGLMCHNTWLEWICGCGYIVGSLMVLYFIYNMGKLSSFGACGYFDEDSLITYQSIVLGLIGTFVALATIDNITNSYLWFTLITAQYMLSEVSDMSEFSDAVK